MAKFHFSFCVRPDQPDFFVQHIELEAVDEGIQITCDSPEVECVHLLTPENYEAFVKAIGQNESFDVIKAARIAVKRNKSPLVFSALHSLSETKFTWCDSDSAFYGGLDLDKKIGESS